MDHDELGRELGELGTFHVCLIICTYYKAYTLPLTFISIAAVYVCVTTLVSYSVAVPGLLSLVTKSGDKKKQKKQGFISNAF